MKDCCIITARFIVTGLSDIIQNGSILLHNGRIAQIGRKDDLLRSHSDAELWNLDNRIVMPALVNAHTHVSLSDAHQVNTGKSFPNWLLDLVEYRKDLTNLELLEISVSGFTELYAKGITTIADADPTLIPLKAALVMNFRGLFYMEVFGLADIIQLLAVHKYKKSLREAMKIANEHTRIGVSPHTPYTVTPQVFRFAADFAHKNNLPVSVHVAESADEIEFLNSKKGKYREFFAPISNRIPVADKTPLMYVDSYGMINSNFLCVHGVHLTDDEFKLLADKGASLVTCPSSNRNLSAGRLDIEKPLSHGVNLCVGTDSPASSDGYDLFHELRLALRYRTSSELKMKPSEAIKLITINAAKAIGFENEVGSIEIGKSADIIAIDINDNLSDKTDIHEYILDSVTSECVSFTTSQGRIVHSKI